MVAYVPGAVNGLVLSPNRVLAAQQFGVKVGGRDIFADAVSTAYAGAGVQVTWIDDFQTYHKGAGEVHCGTNSLRSMTEKWWARG